VGKFLWHEQYDTDRDDFLFVHELIKQLLASEEMPFKIDSSNIFGTGFSSGGIFLYSYVLGGPGLTSPIFSM
jgi:poly(3-hydroxybutyrate) depolymerase